MRRGGTHGGRGERCSSGRRLPGAALFAIHLGGVAAVACALAAVVLPGSHVGILWTAAIEHGEIQSNLWFNAAMHLALSTLLWFVAAGAAEGLWRKRHRLRVHRRAVEPSAGSAYVEFLAVLPVFLLLTFGLLQLTMINIGAALARVAAYESARTVWLWQPEIQANSDVQLEDVANRARIAAALVMTPVAPGHYRMNDPASVTGDEHDAFIAVRDAMTVRFDESILSTSETLDAPAVDLELESRQATLVSALDASDMTERAFRKFTFSYLSTEVDPMDGVIVEGPDPCDPNNEDDQGDISRVGAHFSYYQHMNMPFVDRAFGQPAPDGADFAGRGGQYFEWDIKFTFPMQRQCPNRNTP